MTHHRQTVIAPDAPNPVGAYSPAVIAGSLLFCSGQIPVDAQTGEIIGQTAAEQTAQCLKNLEIICEAADAQLEDAVRMTIYTTDMGQFPQINEIYSNFFTSNPPARVTIGVAALPKGAIVEIDATVAIGD